MIIYTIIISCSLSINIDTKANHVTINEEKRQAEIFEVKGDRLFSEEQYVYAAHAFQKAVNLYLQLEDWEGLIYCYEGIASSYFKHQQNMDSALVILEKAILVINNNVNTVLDRQHLIARLWSDKGYFYWNTYRYEEAVKAYEESKNRLQNQLKLDHRNACTLAIVYQNLANVFLDKADYQTALSFFEQALRISNCKQKSDYELIVLGNRAFALQKLKYFDKAITSYREVIKELKQQSITENIEDLITYTNNWATCYIQKGNPERALQLLHQVLSYHKVSKYDMDITYQNISKAYEIKREYTIALDTLLLVIPVKIKKYKEKGDEFGVLYQDIAQLYFLQKKLPNAFYYYQKSLTALSHNFNEESNIHANPDLTQISSKIDLLKTLSSKSEVLYAYYQTTKEVPYLNTALNTYILIDKLLQEIRQGVHAEGSKLLLAEQNHSICEQAIQTALTLYQLTNNKQYQQQAFHFAEKSKALVLLDAVKDIDAKTAARIPADLIERERQLKIQIFQSEKKINALTDEGERNVAKDNKFNLQQQLQQFQDTLEQSYPKYYQLKYAPTVATVQDVQQSLAKNTALLEYFVGDTTIYLFALTKQTITTYAIPKKQVWPVISELWENAWNANKKMTSSTYIEKAHTLYTQLVQQAISKQTNITNIIIIPDDSLYCVPFDALVTQPQQSVKNFEVTHMAYFIKDYASSYAYSSSLLFKGQQGQQKINPSASSIPFLGFGLAFEQSPKARLIGVSTNSYMSCNGDRIVLPKLKETIPEVNHVYKILDGKIYTEDEAKKDTFKTYSTDATILHLATHACAAADPNESRIHFKDEPLLHREIYHLHLPNTQLTVLSACQTGSGVLKPGEGAMSLARAFLYAGCPSVLTNLWNASDQASSYIIEKFYRYLKVGKTKSEALQQAKRDYLEQEADDLSSHPHIWAASAIIGQGDAVFSATSPAYYFKYIVIISIVLVLFFVILHFGNIKCKKTND